MALKTPDITPAQIDQGRRQDRRQQQKRLLLRLREVDTERNQDADHGAYQRHVGDAGIRNGRAQIAAAKVAKGEDQ